MRILNSHEETRILGGFDTWDVISYGLIARSLYVISRFPSIAVSNGKVWTETHIMTKAMIATNEEHAQSSSTNQNGVSS